MAGTYAEMATLAANATFKDAVKVALMKAAATKLIGNPSSGELAAVQRVIDNLDGYVDRVAWSVACAVPVVANAAPTVPADADLLTAVNAVLPYLVR